MSKIITTLNLVNLGECCTVIKISDNCKLKHRLKDFGIINGCFICPYFKYSTHNLVAYEINRKLVALRDEDCLYIYVEVSR